MVMMFQTSVTVQQHVYMWHSIIPIMKIPPRLVVKCHHLYYRFKPSMLTLYHLANNHDPGENKKEKVVEKLNENSRIILTGNL